MALRDMPPGMGQFHTTKNSPTPNANGDELEEAKRLTEVRYHEERRRTKVNSVSFESGRLRFKLP